MKIYVLQTRRPESGFPIAPNWLQIGKRAVTSQFSDMTPSSIFSRCFAAFVKFSYWPKLHVTIITGSGVITISFYKGLTRNPEITNTSV